MGETWAEVLVLAVVAAAAVRVVWVRLRRVPPAQDPVYLGDALARGRDKQRRFGSSGRHGQDGEVDEMGGKQPWQRDDR